MIDNFEKVVKEEMKVQVIPKLEPVNFMKLTPGDTLCITVDSDKWDIEMAKQFYELFEKAFPNNNILTIFDGIQLSVIKESKE